MKYRWGAAGLLVVAIVVWWFAHGDRASDDVVGAGAAPVATHASRVRVPDQRATGGRRVAGVVELDGAPVADATVRLIGLLGDEHVTTDATGHFDFGLEPLGEYAVAAQASKRTGAVRALDLRKPDVVADDLHLVLYACSAAIYGTVRDVSGGVIPNARISHSLDGTFPDLETATGGDGTYELCMPVGNTTMQVTADGYATIASRLSAYGRTRHDVELPPEAVVQGRVVRAGDHAPVEGAQVDLRTSSTLRTGIPRPQHAVSDADGRFHFSGATTGTHELSAIADGLSTARPLQVVAQVVGTNELVCELVPASTVAGKVVEEGTAVGVVGVGVTLANRYETRRGVTGADGAFAFTSVPSGDYLPGVVVERTRYPRIVVADADLRGVTLAIAARVEIAGRVTRKHQPVEGAVVSTAGSTPTMTDHEGRYALELAAGKHSLYSESNRVGARRSPAAGRSRRRWQRRGDTRHAGHRILELRHARRVHRQRRCVRVR